MRSSHFMCCLPPPWKTPLPRFVDVRGTGGNLKCAAPACLTPFLSSQSSSQGRIACPALWLDASDAASGTAPLHLVYAFGGGPQLCRLPLKPVTLQPVRKTPPTPTPVLGGCASYKAFIPAKTHLQLYRLVHSLGPLLQRWHRELQSGSVHVVRPGQEPGEQAVGVEQVRAMPTDKVCWHAAR